MARLGDVCEILDNQRVPVTASERKPGPYPYYGANGVQDYVSDYIFDDELILLAEDGGNFGSKEKPIAYRVSGKCWVNNHAHVLKPKEGYDIDYVCYSLMYYDVTNLVNGATRQKLTQADMRKMTIPDRPLEEQRRIAAILDKVTSLIDLRKQQLAKLDELVKARFVEMFGEPVTNPMGWPVHRLSEYIIFLTSGSRGWSKYFTDAGEIFITIKNVKDCKINLNDVQYVTPPQNAEAKRTKVQEGDLLISITADLGRTGVVSKEIAKCGGYINQHLTCIRLQKEILHPLYIAYYMESEAGKRQFHRKNQAGVKAGLNFDSIKSLTIALPPIEVQNSFVSYVSQIDRQMLTIRQGLDILKMLQKSMMQDYFESRGDGK